MDIQEIIEWFKTAKAMRRRLNNYQSDRRRKYRLMNIRKAGRR